VVGVNGSDVICVCWGALNHIGLHRRRAVAESGMLVVR
jgi:hypothetical protein